MLVCTVTACSFLCSAFVKQCLIEETDSIFFISCSLSPMIRQTLHSFSKKASLQARSLHYSLLVSGTPTPNPSMKNQTFRFAEIIGHVPIPIQQEVSNNFVEEVPDIKTVERRWPKGIALGTLGVVFADNRDPRLALDSTMCGMNERCHLPERQKLPNLRHLSPFLSTCPPLQNHWQGASIDIKAAHKRMLI